MFESFDFRVLDDPTFKEDAVREEIIAPILKRLGYQPSGMARIQRSKALTHPFVRIGTRKHPVNIIPDYTLYFEDEAILVLDAKAPGEAVVESHHVEQAYSYAIHPEVRCQHYALCNGRELVLYDVQELDAVFRADVRDTDARWAEIEKHFAPKYLLEPVLRYFMPDLGAAVLKLGLTDPLVVFPRCQIDMIGRVSDQVVTAHATCEFREVDHFASFDFAPDMLGPMLACLPRPLHAEVLAAFARAPFQVFVDRMVEVDCTTRLGKLTNGLDDSFVPFLVTEILDSRLNDTPPPEVPDGIPPHVFHVRRAFERLRGAG